MQPLRGVVISSTPQEAEILCENGSKLVTTYTKNLEFGVEVEILFESDTLKVTKIRRINSNRESLEDKESETEVEHEATDEDMSDQDYYDRVGVSPTNR